MTVLKGQCSLSVKNEIKADEDHKNWSSGDNAVASLMKIEELLCSTTEVQCKHWMMMNNMHKMMTLKQNNGEPMSKFHKRFGDMVNTIEGQWGDSHPNENSREQQ